MTEKILEENIRIVKEKIRLACKAVGKREEDVTLVAATKMNDAETVSAALRLGLDAAGENRVQELLEKYEQHAYGDKPLHFIGTLQSNKVKYLIGKTALIQSVSSLKLASVIGKEAGKRGKVQDVLLEVNIGEESSKSGFLSGEIAEAVEICGRIPGICVKGLMTIPPKAYEKGENNRYFDKMYQLFVDISSRKYDNVNMKYLSMGMSDDYEDAILHGANMVRVGTAIFGRRRYSEQNGSVGNKGLGG